MTVIVGGYINRMIVSMWSYIPSLCLLFSLWSYAEAVTESLQIIRPVDYFSNFFLAFLSPLATVVVKYFMGDGLVRFQFLVCNLVCTLKGGNYWLWQKFGTWPSAFKIVLIIIDHSIPGLVTW